MRYGVIGAGALGLTVALRLAERGHDVTVLERDPVPGGLAGSYEQAWSFAAPFAQPIVTPAFARSIPGFDTPVAGLYVANMFQVYPYDRGQNYSIQLAERLVGHLEG